MNKIIDILKRIGLKKTVGRVAILELFQKNLKPASALEIFKKIKGKKIDMVTIYRTLQSFEKAGILKRVDLRKESVCYELIQAGRHHHHIVCDNCGEVEDFEISEEQRIFENALGKSRKFDKITDHSLEIFGICKPCAKT